MIVCTIDLYCNINHSNSGYKSLFDSDPYTWLISRWNTDLCRISLYRVYHYVDNPFSTNPSNGNFFYLLDQNADSSYYSPRCGSII